MSNPIVIAYHLIWTLYGWWLPNDLRGSTSKTIRSDALRELGELHFGRNKIQPASHEIKNFHAQAQSLLKYPLLELSTRSIAIVADGFAEVIRQFRYTCYACAILPDHIHLILRKHRDSAEEMIARLQDAGRLRLSASGLFPPNHPIWVRGGWKVFLDHPDEIHRTIGYIENNPLPYGMAIQKYDFVMPYDNWPLHEGHDAHSPYARALRAAGRYPRER
jgi:REP element-mobilizing transposase RayT